MSLRLGTRSSRLALWQARTVAALLRDRGVECEVVTIETRGDDITDRPLPEIGGDGVFTERIERALRASEIDIAVHSLKDLPVVDPDELCVGAVLAREEVRDVLISRGARTVSTLAVGAVVGSSSTRRQAQLLALRPDLIVSPIRGNVETRIRKVVSGEYDATLLAGAGVVRLGMERAISQWLEISQILPAPGQGAIAVQCRAADEGTRRALAAIDEPALHAETDAERGFLRALGGGCSAPVGAFARVSGRSLHLRGRVSALDGSRSVDVEGESEDFDGLVADLAQRALREGADNLIQSAAGASKAAASAGGAAFRPTNGSSLRGRRVVVTRARDQADELSQRLASAGAVPLSFPMIRIAPLENTPELDAALARLVSYRWILFASVNAVEFFMNRLEEIAPSRTAWPPGCPRVGAVGPGTAAALSRRGISADFVPSVHTGVSLAEGILSQDVLAGARVLIPRAREGREDAAALLRGNGAIVDEVPAYRTEACAPTLEDCRVLEPSVDAVLFTSSSAVSAWCDAALPGGALVKAARRAVIACIGPSTSATARARGLRVDVEAPSHSVDGLVAALGQHFARTQGVTQ
jgi:hydroxymethylbilane synthase